MREAVKVERPVPFINTPIREAWWMKLATTTKLETGNAHRSIGAEAAGREIASVLLSIEPSKSAISVPFLGDRE
jgi:hypothetical protein